MPKIDINKTNINKITRPTTGQVFYWDNKLPGFGIKATPTRLMYVAQRRANGKTVRFRLGWTEELSPEQAREDARDALHDIRKGTHLNAARKKDKAREIVLRQAFADYKKSRNLRSETVKGYEGIMRRCFSEWQEVPLEAITKDMIERRHKELSTANGPRGKGAAQANLAMRMLRAIFNYAIDTYSVGEGMPFLSENPVRRLSKQKLWNRVPRRQNIIEDHQLKAWYAAVLTLENSTIRDYLILCLFTGLRRTEATKLRWSNVRWDSRTLVIPGADAKNHEEHRLPLPDLVYDLLHQRRNAKVRRIGNDYVFPGEGENDHLVESKWCVKLVRERSGVYFTIHDLRRTFGTIAERLDVPHYSLKRLLNHKTNSDVTSGYIIPSVDRLREPMQKIADYIKTQAQIKKSDSAAASN